MTFIDMIFTALASAALVKGSIECNFSEPAADRQCFGAVGQLLVFHLSNTPNTSIRVRKDNKDLILNIRNQNVTLHEEYGNRSELFTNGTITLGNAMKRHCGDYLLEEYGANGDFIKSVNVHLEIQVPVSKPVVSQMCLSPEQRSISCSSEGDEVEFIFNLNGLLLVHTRGFNQSLSSRPDGGSETLAGSKRDKPGVSKATVSFHSELTGVVTCRAQNNISRDETFIHLKSCKDLVSSFPFLPVTVAACAVTLLLLMAVCVGIIKLHNNPRLTTAGEGDGEEEIVYADVRFKKVTRKTEQNVT